MSEPKNYPRGEITRRGNELFERTIRAELPPGAPPQAFVAIDIETGDYEVDASEVAAVNRLMERHPEAKGRICLRRVGSESAYHIGRRFHTEKGEAPS